MKIVLDPGAKMPTRAHEWDAGLDLYAMHNVVVKARGRAIVSTGCHFEIPKGYVGLLTSKSGLMSKQGVTTRGTIDSGYTGAVHVVLFNHSEKAVTIKKGEKISQMVILPILTPELEVVSSLEETERGDGGFGSTGKF